MKIEKAKSIQVSYVNAFPKVREMMDQRKRRKKKDCPCPKCHEWRINKLHAEMVAKAKAAGIALQKHEKREKLMEMIVHDIMGIKRKEDAYESYVAAPSAASRAILIGGDE